MSPRTSVSNPNPESEYNLKMYVFQELRTSATGRMYVPFHEGVPAHESSGPNYQHTVCPQKPIENIKVTNRILYNHVNTTWLYKILSSCIIKYLETVCLYVLTSALSLMLFLELRVPPLVMVVSYSV